MRLSNGLEKWKSSAISGLGCAVLYSAANGHANYVEHRKQVEGQYSMADYGQQEPDAAWLARNNGAGDQRGVCIPPYFVFQFRSDGHPSPLTATTKVAH